MKVTQWFPLLELLNRSPYCFVIAEVALESTCTKLLTSCVRNACSKLFEQLSRKQVIDSGERLGITF